MDYILAVLLYAEKRLESVARVAHVIRSIAVPMRLLLVVNNPTLDSATVRRTFAGDKRTRVIRHDNSGLEFGGYQAAINSMRDSLPPRLMVMNDTLGAHDVPTRAYLAAFMRQTAVDEEKLVVAQLMAPTAPCHWADCNPRDGYAVISLESTAQRCTHQGTSCTTRKSIG